LCAMGFCGWGRENWGENQLDKILVKGYFEGGFG